MEIEVGTAQAFLEERKGWLRVVVAQSPDGGFDILLRIDGTYTEREDAEGIARMFRRDLRKMFRRDLRELRDVPQDGWNSWPKEQS